VPPIADAAIGWAAALIEFGGSLVLVGYMIAAFAGLLARRVGIHGAKLLVAQGAAIALSFKLSAALLKTIELQTFDQIGVAVVIFALRKLIATALAHEKRTTV
jgi:hypothetical protein